MKREAVCIFHKKQRALEEENIVKREMQRLMDYLVSEIRKLTVCVEALGIRLNNDDINNDQIQYDAQYLTGCLVVLGSRRSDLEHQLFKARVLFDSHINIPDYEGYFQPQIETDFEEQESDYFEYDHENVDENVDGDDYGFGVDTSTSSP